MNDVLDFLRSLGFEITTLIANGQVQRCGAGSKPQWYVSHQNFVQKTGEQFYVTIACDWRDGEIHKHCTLIGKMSSEEKRTMERQIKDAQAKADAHKLKEQSIRCIDVEQKWEKLSETGVSEYLVKKKISVDVGVRYDGTDLYVPLRDVEGKLWSLQKIGSNGFKQFHEGARFQGCFHVIGELGSTVYIAEGLSTAASVFMAVNTGVVVAFNSGNLVNVAVDLKKKYPHKAFVICGDNDLWSMRKKNGEEIPYNAGKEKAEEAAKRVLGTVCLPNFTNLDQRPTDFNDLHVTQGIEEVARQVTRAKAEKSGIMALGFRDNDYFFTSTSNKQISVISNFSSNNLLKIMPKEYWEAAYPASSDGKIDWIAAASHLMIQARKKGIFEPQNVRGAGVWKDADRVIINMGNYLMVDGQMVAIDEIDSRYFYTLGKRMKDLHPTRLSLKDCEIFDETCRQFKWQKPESGILLAGWLITSKICGALPVRPHVWITGGASTGKSTLMQGLINPFLEGHGLYLQGGTTEAGIRQALRADALPLLFDEFETTGDKSYERIQAIIELLRSSWSESDGFIVKGSAQGIAAYYQARFSAIVSSIRTGLTNDADRSRFAVLELAPHGDDVDNYKKLLAAFKIISTEDYIDRLYVRSLEMIPVILENFIAIRSALATRVSQRFGQQYGMLLAGYSILLSDEALSEAEIKILLDSLAFEEQKEQAKVADHEECLNFMMTKKVTLDVDSAHSSAGRHDVALVEAIERAKSSEFWHKALQRFGIAVDSEKSMFYVHTENTELKIIFRSERWKNLAETLSRIPGSQRSVVKKISGKPQRTVALPLSLLS